MSSTKPLVIYHSPCLDGFASCYAAWRKLGDEAEYYPIQYGYKELPSFYHRDVYILDFSLRNTEEEPHMKDLFHVADRVVWLDHHKGAFEMWCDPIHYQRGIYQSNFEENQILLNNNKSGAMLSWEYFHPNTPIPDIIKYVQDRDLWKFQYPETKDIIAGLGSYEFNFGVWDHFVHNDQVSTLKYEGIAINRERAKVLNSIVKSKYRVVIKGLNGWVVNCPGIYSSEVGELANTDKTFVICWYENDEAKIICSVRSKKESLVSAQDIAVMFGGNGHTHASGMQVKKLILNGICDGTYSQIS